MIKLNNTWCEATRENYDELVVLVFTQKINLSQIGKGTFYVKGDTNTAYFSKELKTTNPSYKQIHLINNEFQYVEDTINKATETVIRAKGQEALDKRVLSKNEIKSIIDKAEKGLEKENGMDNDSNSSDNMSTRNMDRHDRLNSFNTYGFETPDYKVLEGIEYSSWLYLKVNDDRLNLNHDFMVAVYLETGEAIDYGGNNDFSCYNLKKLKKNWYENEDNFPCAVIYNGGMSGNKDKIIIMRYYNKEKNVLCSQEGGIYHNMKSCRIATQEEISKLLVKE